MSSRRCTNPTCYLHDTKVDTDITDCIGCGERLKTNGDVFDQLFGDGLSNALTDLFKNKDKP